MGKWAKSGQIFEKKKAHIPTGRDTLLSVDEYVFVFGGESVGGGQSMAG